MLRFRRRAHTDQMPRAMLLSAAIAAAYAEPGARLMLFADDGAPAAGGAAPPAGAPAAAAAVPAAGAAPAADGKPAAAAPAAGSTASSATTVIEQPGNIIAESAAAPVTVDDQKKLLIEKGAKADDLAKLSEADLKAKYDEAVKPAPAEPTADDARKFLIEKGGKAEDIAKLTDDDAIKQMKAAQDKQGDTKIDIKIPDGVKIDDKALADFTTIMSDDKLSPSERAQKLVDMHLAVATEAAQAPYKQWVTTQKEWQAKVQADPELGGTNFATVTKPAIDKAIKHFATTPAEETELREAFNFTGAGNHPAMVRMMTRIGKFIGEGGPVNGGKPAATGQKSPAEKMYPSQAKAST